MRSSNPRRANITAAQFTEILGALPYKAYELAAKLDRCPASVSRYRTGSPIPQSVGRRLMELLAEEREKIMAKAHHDSAELEALATRIESANSPDVAALLQYRNVQKQIDNVPVPHMTEGRFMRRHYGYDTGKLHPRYRMTRERSQTLLRALSAWNSHVRYLSTTYTDSARQRDYRAELIDLRAIAERFPRHLPYDMCITEAEWNTISRALRHLTRSTGDPSGASLLRHWTTHKYTGYPPVPLSADDDTGVP